MRGWSLRSPGAREAVHITLLSLLANLLFLVCSALLTKRFDAEEKMFALLATADVLSGGRVWFLDAAITLAVCAVFGVVGVVGLCVDARSGCCGRGGAAGERTPLKT